MVLSFVLKGYAKTVPLHSALSAHPRFWLGADTKATSVALYPARPKVMLDWDSSDSSRLQQHNWKSVTHLLALHAVVFPVHRLICSHTYSLPYGQCWRLNRTVWLLVFCVVFMFLVCSCVINYSGVFYACMLCFIVDHHHTQACHCAESRSGEDIFMHLFESWIIIFEEAS